MPDPIITYEKSDDGTKLKVTTTTTKVDVQMIDLKELKSKKTDIDNLIAVAEQNGVVAAVADDQQGKP